MHTLYILTAPHDLSLVCKIHDYSILIILAYRKIDYILIISSGWILVCTS